jgi:hypothetical protein
VESIQALNNSASDFVGKILIFPKSKSKFHFDKLFEVQVSIFVFKMYNLQAFKPFSQCWPPESRMGTHVLLFSVRVERPTKPSNLSYGYAEDTMNSINSFVPLFVFF